MDEREIPDFLLAEARQQQRVRYIRAGALFVWGTVALAAGWKLGGGWGLWLVWALEGFITATAQTYR